MITFQEEKRIFTLDTRHTTYQMMADSHGVFLHLYYGRKTGGEMDYLIRRYDRGFSGNPYDAGDDRTYSLDVLPQEYPCLGMGDYRRSALMVEWDHGAVGCDLRYDSYEIRRGKYAIEGLPAVYAEDEEAETLAVTLKDNGNSGLIVQLLYGVLPELDIITRSVLVKNEGSRSFALTRFLSANLDFFSGDFDLLTFYGRHGMERTLQREPLNHGVKMIGSSRGMSSHQYNPLMILAGKETTEDFGLCYAMEFVYSGGFLAEAEKDAFDQTRVQMGLMSERFHWPLAPGESISAPEVILSCSTEGLARLSQNLHACIRKHIIRGRWRDELRPILLNSWEGCYFSFDGKRILDLAEQASQLGLDMLVMDDGWFGKRDTDRSGLGDWQVNEEKLGCTLQELIAGVHEKGLRFGIWVEPEMISEDSDLYRAHPDWALALPGRKPVRARNQLVLDFSRKEIVDAIYEQIAGLLRQGGIDYVKWDYNRSISEVYSPEAEEQGTVLHRYMLGLYSFLERMHGEFPDLILEGCSGGGGRFDAGMMYYAPQIWCSDNTDAVDRLQIQYGTSFGYPVSEMGAHVSVCPNHQSGRVTPLRTRGVVAMAGTFGYELDPGVMTPEEKEEVKKQLAVYRRFAPLIAEGRYFRLSDPSKDPIAAWLFVSENGGEALLCTVNLETHCNSPQRYVRLRGLDGTAFYSIVDAFGEGEREKPSIPELELPNSLSGTETEEQENRKYPGAALMETGLPIPLEIGEYGARMLHIKRVE